MKPTLCPNCGKLSDVPESYFGRSIKCARCNSDFKALEFLGHGSSTGGAAAGRSKRPVQTIEATGKGLKIQIAISAALIVVGLIFSMFSEKTGIFGPLFFIIGLLNYIVTKVRIWWNHG